MSQYLLAALMLDTKLRIGALVATLLAASCRADPAPSPAIEAASTSSVVPDAAAPAESPCAVLERTQLAALAKVPDCMGPPDGLGAGSGRLLRSCVPTRHGAWGLVLQNMPEGSPENFCALQEAARFGMVSGVASLDAHAAHVRDGVLTEGAAISWLRLDEVRGFDFDGDGEEELLITARSGREFALHSDGVMAMPLAFALVLQAEAGRIAPLTSTAGLSMIGFEDVDADGRPDPLTTQTMYGADGDVTSWTFLGPKVVAHSLPDGAFSTTDAVAAASARRECASPTLERAHARDLFKAALCARMLGASPAEVTRRYLRRCRSLKGVGASVGPSSWGVDDGISLFAVCNVHNDSGADVVFGVPERIVALVAAMRPLAP